jgi:hypothetical protein
MSDVTKYNSPLDRMFGRLLTASSTKPYDLPVFKTFSAPAEGRKFDAFFAGYRASGWDLEQALKPYEKEELEGMVAFQDLTTGEYKFCPTMRFLLLNGIHVKLTPSNDD